MTAESMSELDPTEIEAIESSAAGASATDTFYQTEEAPEPGEKPLAPLSERFAAFSIDTIILTYLIALAHPYLIRQLGQTVTNPLHWERIPLLSLVGFVAAIVFFYFFLFEAILARTPGKLLCRLSVASHYGGPPSIFSVLIRNLLRFVDVLLFPITGFGLAEASSKRQRLGDFLAGTTVRGPSHRGKSVLPPEEIRWGTVTRRSVVLLVDLVFFLSSALFFLLALPTDRRNLALLLLNTGPLWTIAYWVGSETFLGGTPAKLLCGLRVVDEGARPVRIPASFIRNLFRLLDHNPLGYLCAVLSSRKQRPGDLAARTSVIRNPCSLKRLLSFVIAVTAIAGLGYYGIHNPKSFIRTDHRITIGPWLLPELPPRIKYYLGYRLFIKDFYFGRPGAPAGEQPHYSAGEVVYTTVEISGFVKQQGRAWLQQDLLVTDAGGNALIDLLNVTNRRFDVGNLSSQLLTASFLIPPMVEPGPYTVRVRVRDAAGNMEGEMKGTLVIR